MYGKGYAWLIPGWYPHNWYAEEDDDVDCTVDELINVVESSMYISTQERLLGQRDAMTVAGIVRQFCPSISSYAGFPQSGKVMEKSWSCIFTFQACKSHGIFF